MTTKDLALTVRDAIEQVVTIPTRGNIATWPEDYENAFQTLGDAVVTLLEGKADVDPMTGYVVLPPDVGGGSGGLGDSANRTLLLETSFEVTSTSVSAFPTVPADARYAEAQIQQANVRHKQLTNPAPTDGEQLLRGDTYAFRTLDELLNARLIAESATATVFVRYYSAKS
ncbi:hypothetical protein [Deinococcus peraridilitoris]|uniref:Uncharacterized protein n=1 Tax=Deinococcus peraridilitoris (strain DSM 19664 / LMG 22246 / CIP 109416 / KR-200) TaxID=937777 RepID=L0A165_DEIPD|nr:hypothetical protein [Deinococcus peraridilitoris]AFZ67581.1 hypothetical protein Deipe_2085 [Deinococcus peraridilitoris DSM 19664]